MKNKNFILVILLFIFLLTGCGSKSQGSMWYIEISDPSSSFSGNVGDMYLNSTTEDLFQLTESGWIKVGNIKGQNIAANNLDINVSQDGYWVINGKKTDKKAVGEDGKNGIDASGESVGKDGKDGVNGKTPSIKIGTNGNWFINGKDTSIKANGNDGTSFYVGYDNYFWNGKDRTNYKVDDVVKKDDVVESTIGILGTMDKYFDTKYLNLSNNKVAMMSYYMSKSGMTLYSNSSVLKVSIYAETDGTIDIGTAKIDDVVLSRTSGSNLSSSMSTYNVKKGLNVIELNLSIDEDETLVLGGNNSVGILFSKGINIDDEQGVFTLLNSKSNASIIQKTDNINDKLVIEIIAEFGGSEERVFPNIRNEYSDSSVSSMSEYQYKTGNPYSYSNKTYFSGKKITRIGAPIKSVKAVDDNQYYTVCVLKQSVIGTGKHTCERTYKIYLPVSELSSTTVNKWIYVDVDINIEDDETLGFSALNDSAIIGYDNIQGNSVYNFYPNSATAKSTEKILWDIYYVNNVTLQEHIDELKNIEKTS